MVLEKSLKMIAFFVFEPWFRPIKDSETFRGYEGKRFKAKNGRKLPNLLLSNVGGGFLN